MAQPLMNSKRAAGYLNISHPALYKLIEHKEIPVARVRGSWLFSPVALDAWVKKQREERIAI